MKLDRIFNHRNSTLLKELVATDFKLRYQGSALGYLWSLVRPLFLFLILLFVFGYVLGVKDNIAHYPIYLLIGIVLWNFFLEATSLGLQSIVSRGDLIRKINIPKYIIVISGTISALINLGISLIIVLIFIVVSGVTPNVQMLYFVPLMFELYILALAISFFLSALFVKYRDVSYIWELLLQAAFYATPIIYPLSVVSAKSHTIAHLMLLNPVAQIIQDSRYVLISHQTSTLFNTGNDKLLVIVPPLLVAISVWLASSYFRKNSYSFAENV